MVTTDVAKDGPCRPVSDGKSSLFALVVYIPDPLGKFLDDLRRELVPGCSPHAHVSVLPPRSLACKAQAAQDFASALAAGFAPFEISIGAVEVFQRTDVIYLSVERGAEALRRMHDAMAGGALAFTEPYAYHPHTTLAQEIDHGEVRPLVNMARRRWEEYSGPRSFLADTVTFVQSRALNQWVDLADFPLGAAELIK